MSTAPPRWHFVPDDLDAGDLTALEDLFGQLQDREFVEVGDLRRWLLDESELSARISAEKARRYIRKRATPTTRSPRIVTSPWSVT